MTTVVDASVLVDETPHQEAARAAARQRCPPRRRSRPGGQVFQPLRGHYVVVQRARPGWRYSLRTGRSRLRHVGAGLLQPPGDLRGPGPVRTRHRARPSLQGQRPPASLPKPPLSPDRHPSAPRRSHMLQREPECAPPSRCCRPSPQDVGSKLLKGSLRVVRQTRSAISRAIPHTPARRSSARCC